MSLQLLARVWILVLSAPWILSDCTYAQEGCRDTIGNANVNFIPGDAFFSTALTEKDLAALTPTTNKLELDYRLPGSVRSFGGQFGYAVLELDDLGNEFAIALKRECAWLRKGHPLRFVRIVENGTEVLNELNPIRVLVYDSTFNAEKSRLGLRYNEGWNHESHAAKARLFGRSSKIVTHGVVPYVAFTETAESVVEDWMNGPHVPALDVSSTEPSFDPFLKHDSESGGTAKVNRSCKLLILEPVALNDYFLQLQGLRYVELSLDGKAERFRFVSNGKVERSKGTEVASERLPSEPE